MELTMRGVRTRLGGRWVIDGIDATPPPGLLTGLLGPNGSGKTTLLRLVAGLLVPEGGAVLVSPTPDDLRRGQSSRSASRSTSGPLPTPGSDSRSASSGSRSAPAPGSDLGSTPGSRSAPAPGSDPGSNPGTRAPEAPGSAAPAARESRPEDGPPVPVHMLARPVRARRIALLEQDSSSTVPLTVREVVALGRIPYQNRWGTDADGQHRAAVDRALASSGALHLAERAWSSLSGGERQRVHIARALAQEPELLLLDEPTNHLDVSAQLHLLAFVRDLGTTTIAALHDLNLAATFCEHVLVLSEGRLAAAGHPRDVLQPALLREVYGVDADILIHPRTGRPVIALNENGTNR